MTNDPPIINPAKGSLVDAILHVREVNNTPATKSACTQALYFLQINPHISKLWSDPRDAALIIACFEHKLRRYNDADQRDYPPHDSGDTSTVSGG